MMKGILMRFLGGCAVYQVPSSSHLLFLPYASKQEGLPGLLPIHQVTNQPERDPSKCLRCRVLLAIAG
jgi:hypothetical protein